MQKRRLGRTELEVPVVGLGTWKVFDVNGITEEASRHDVVKAALEHGANLFDSSPMYGEAERVLGDAIRPERKNCILATKVWTNKGTYDADEQIAASLRIFGDIIDIYQIHNLSEWPLVLDKLEALKADGKIRSIGITHYVEPAFPEMMEIMRTGRIDVIQVPYNALLNEAAKDILPLAKELDLGVMVMVPLGTGKLVRIPIPAEELEAFEAYNCTTWAQVLLNYIISDERVHTAIPATSSPVRMKENALAGSAKPFDEEMRERVRALAERYAEVAA